MNPFPILNYDIITRFGQIVYSIDNLSIISRPAIVITENDVILNHYFNREEDVKRARFTTVPNAFINRCDWIKIHGGVPYAETKMQVGESKRHVPFLTKIVPSSETTF